MNDNATAPRCAKCNLSTDPSKPDFAHVRLGLDEAPEPLLCKCKSDDEILNGVMMKLASAVKYVDRGGRTIRGKIMSADLNPVVIKVASRIPNVEVEARLSTTTSESMYAMMKRGFFGNTDSSKIVELGCSWWTGRETNSIARLRKRSNGETTAKTIVHVCEMMPGIKIAVSYEFEFVGEISRPEYKSVMNELSTTISIGGVVVKVISRMYECETASSFASEIEFKPGITHKKIKEVVNEIISMVGSENKLASYIDFMFMSEIRHADHDVVDVADMSLYKGSFMIKADGMKVYVFCYPNGYVVTFTDAVLTVISYVIATSYAPVVAISSKPDVIIAEMTSSGNLVYLDTLSTNGEAVSKLREYASKPTTECEKPFMTVRKIWGSIKDVPKNPISTVPADGIVCVTGFRTLRLKKPTIDLVYSNGVLFMDHERERVPVAAGHELMMEGVVYEMTVSKTENRDVVRLSNATRRLIKSKPNNSDIIRRAFMSAIPGENTNTILYDITSMSFSMRLRVYELAQANASVTRSVIVVFGAGRLQELNEMKTSNFSYIVIDPMIDFATVIKRLNRMTVVPYDTNTSFSKQVMSISNRPGRLIYYKGFSENFIMMSDVISFMSAMGIPAVFSFSISYHIRVINTLKNSGINTFGCGYVHDNMPVNGIESGP